MSIFKDPPPLFKHQEDTLKFFLETPRVLCFSDAGTGKTRSVIESIKARKHLGKTLILAPKSILEPAWGNDIRKFAPDLTYSIARASNRKAGFDAPVDVIITNFDAVQWLFDEVKKKGRKLDDFYMVVLDECFPADALVNTPTGLSPIESLAVGDLVLTSDGPLPITKTFVKESSDLITMRLSDGTEYTCTSLHPFATEIGWRAASKTAGLRTLRYQVPDISKKRSKILLKKLLQEEHVGYQGYDRNSQKDVTKSNGAINLEQRDSVPARNEKTTEPSTYKLRSSTKGPWWKRKNLALRTDDARDAARVLGSPALYQDRDEKRERVPPRLQSGLRPSKRKAGFRSGRELTLVTKKLRCKKRFLTFGPRVESITSIECASPTLVYNLQVDGPHDYFVSGILVHNCTAFKNPSAQRSKKLAAMIDNFSHRIALTGTPAPNTILDIWHQAYLIDDGERLGKSFYKFRGTACDIENPYASFKSWKDKPGIKEAVADILSPIVIRHKLEECLDIPENNVVEYSFQLNPTARTAYNQMVKESLLDCDLGEITAAQAGVLASKLSQIASGAVYGDENTTITLGDERTELIVQLIEERDQCVVSFLWKHQRDALKAAFEKANIAYGVIDGEANDKQREAAVADFQAGKLKVILAHPQSAGHGLTLTRGTTTIWASPTYNAEFYAQFNARIYRATQTKRTTTIHIIAENTIDSDVYKKLLKKHVNMLDLLALAKENYELNRD